MDISYMTMNRMLEERASKDLSLQKELKRKGRAVLSDARSLSDEELLGKLKRLGIELGRQELEVHARKHYSAESIQRHFLKNRKLNIVRDFDEDWLWFAITILWERWFPEWPSFEMIDDDMQKGYEQLERNDKAGACLIWMKTWEKIHGIMVENEIPSITEFDEIFNGTQSVHNWVQDFDMELHNAGLHDKKFFLDRLSLGEACEKLFPDDPLSTENTRRAIAESHFGLGNVEKGDSLFQDWMEKDPQWGWGWIGWSDCHWEAGNEERARQLLEKGLSVRAVRDGEDISMRMEDRGFLPVEDRYPQFSRKGDAILSQAISPSQPLRSVKIGRNEPCPCGSGKKYKKCCGK